MWGRPSPASFAAWALRGAADGSGAAVRADGGDRPPWQVRAASLAGVRHRLAGVGPEDAYAWAHDDAVLMVAVADGVGSTEGAGAAAAAAAVAAVAAPADPVAAAGMAAAASGPGATTLVVGRIEAGGLARVTRVGDSTAYVLAGGGWREVWRERAAEGTTTEDTGTQHAGAEGTGAQEAGAGDTGAGDTGAGDRVADRSPAPADPDDGGHVEVATAALPAAHPTPETVELRLEPGAVLVLVTDGVAGPLADGPTTVAPGLAAALATPPEPLELARVLDFSRQGCHDDRTLLAVWLCDPSGQEPDPGR